MAGGSGGGAKLATAYYELVASTPGAEGQITAALLPGITSAAKEGGDALGGGLTDALSSKLSGLSPAVISGAIVAGAAVAGKALYDLGAEFDDMSDTIRVGTGATGDALKGLEDNAKTVATTVATDFGTAGQTVADLNTRLGLSGETMSTVASQVIAAGDLMGEALDVNTLTAGLTAFNITGDDTITAMDDLFRVSQATGVGMNELVGAVQKNAPALQELGLGFADATALVGSFDKAGLNSQQMLSGLSKGLVTLAKEGEQPKEAFSRVTGEIQGFIDAGDTAGALDLASKVFGTKGATQFVEAIQNGSLSLTDLTAAAGVTGDTILGTYEETADGAEKMQIMTNKLKVALEPLATTVFNAVGDAIEWVLPYVEAFSAWAQENPGLMQAIVIGIGTLAATLLVLAAAQWAANLAMLASPITWIVLAIVALIAIVVALATNWDSVTAALGAAWDWIVEKWNAGLEWIKTTFSGVFASVAAWWTQTWEDIKAAWTNFWVSLAVGAYNKSNELITWVKEIPTKVKNAFSNAGQWLVSAGKNIISGLFSGLKSGWSRVTGWFSGLGSWIKSHKGPEQYDKRLLIPAGTWIMQGLMRGLEGQIPGLRDVLEGVSTTIEGGISADVGASVRRGTAALAAVPVAAGASSGPAIHITQNYPRRAPDHAVRDEAAEAIRLAGL